MEGYCKWKIWSFHFDIFFFIFSSFKFSLILCNVRVWAIFVIAANVSFFPFFSSTIACLHSNYVNEAYDGNFPSFSSFLCGGIWGLSTWEFQMKKINLIFAVVVIYLTSFSVVSWRRNFFREDIKWTLALSQFSRILFNETSYSYLVTGLYLLLSFILNPILFIYSSFFFWKSKRKTKENK